MKKRKLLLVSLISIIFSISAMGSSAFFNAEDTAHNVITSGSVNISVVETMLDGTELKDFPAEGISGVMPGSTVSKIVRIRNTGSAETWIRVRVDTSVKSDAQAALDAGVVDFSVQAPWIDGGDGYYYCSKAVPVGGETDVLFREVHFAPNMGNEYQNCTVYITIKAEAVQTANNPIPAGGTVLDVVGWPNAEGVV